MGDMTVDELKDKKLWFLWSAKPGRNGKVTKVPFAANGGATGTDDAHKGTWVYLLMMQNQPEISFRHRGLA